MSQKEWHDLFCREMANIRDFSVQQANACLFVRNSVDSRWKPLVPEVVDSVLAACVSLPYGNGDLSLQIDYKGGRILVSEDDFPKRILYGPTGGMKKYSAESMSVMSRW